MPQKSTAPWTNEEDIKNYWEGEYTVANFIDGKEVFYVQLTDQYNVFHLFYLTRENYWLEYPEGSNKFHKDSPGNSRLQSYDYLEVIEILKPYAENLSELLFSASPSLRELVKALLEPVK